MENLDGGIYGAITGFFVTILGVLGLNKKIDEKVSKDAFIEFKEAVNQRFDVVQEDLKEVKEGVKSLLYSTPKK